MPPSSSSSSSVWPTGHLHLPAFVSAICAGLLWPIPNPLPHSRCSFTPDNPFHSSSPLSLLLAAICASFAYHSMPNFPAPLDFAQASLARTWPSPWPAAPHCCATCWPLLLCASRQPPAPFLPSCLAVHTAVCTAVCTAVLHLTPLSPPLQLAS